ncbi:MAG: fibronectin type III domain-containing protein [Ignavibacteriales bacterium]|nr:fibronectin type III domain-containing protein [Ignavibacteriales bacterium]
MNHPKKKIFTYLIAALFLVFFLFGCVESVTDTQTSTTPSIDVFSPKTGDTVKVGQNVINYQAADGASGQGLSYFELYVNNTLKKKYSQPTDGNPTIYLEVDSALIHTRISYSLKVYNLGGKWKESKLQENIYVKDKVPLAPTNLVLSRYGNNSVILKWDPYLPKNADGFELWRRDVINGVEIPYRKIKSLPVSNLSYTDGNLSQYQEYSYYLKAYNESGSSASNIVSTSSLPDGPWNLQAEAIGASSVHLKWVDFALNETAFQIERTDPATNEFKIIKITEGPNITEYYDNSVSASTAYSYRVAYFTQTTMSSYSNIVTLTTFHADVTAPSELASTFVAEGLQISWKDNSQSLSKGTIIERQIGSNEFVEIGNVSSDKTSFIDRAPVSGVSYYRVRQILGTKTYTPYSNSLRVIF